MFNDCYSLRNINNINIDLVISEYENFNVEEEDAVSDFNELEEEDFEIII